MWALLIKQFVKRFMGIVAIEKKQVLRI